MSKLTESEKQQQRIRELEETVADLQQEKLTLIRTEEQFRALFEKCADYVLILEPAADGIPVIVDLNESACTAHGYTREELLGQPISFLDDIETRKNIPDRVRRVLQRVPETFEARHVRKDGTTFMVEVTATAIEVAGKQYIYAVERDITARKHAEAVLHQYERIIATSAEHMSLVDRNYIYQAVNEAYLKAHHLSREEIVGHSVAEMLGRECVETLVKPRLDQCLAGEEVRYQGWFEFAGIGRRFMDVAYYPVLDPTGSVSGAVVNSRDITELEQTHQELAAMNNRLEQRVAERTASLAEVNAHLEKEIAEHRRDKESLRQSEERFRSIFLTSPNIIVISDLEDGLISDVNFSFGTISGYSREEVIGRTTKELGLWGNPEDRQMLVDQLRQEKYLKNMELEFHSKDGRIITVLLSATIIDLDGQQKLLSVVQDISDWKITQEKMRMLAAVVEQTGEGIATADLDGNIIFANRSFAAMHGYRPKDLVGKHLSILHNAEQMPYVEETLRQIRKSGEFRGEVLHCRQDGTVFPGLMQNSLLRDDSGEPVGMIGTLRDISELKNVHMALELREAQFRLIAETSEDILFQFGPEGELAYASPAMKRMLGYEPAAVADRYFSSFVFPLDIPLAETAFLQVMSGQCIGLLELRLVASNKDIIYSEINVAPVTKNNVIVGVLGNVRDISLRKEAEINLLVAQQKMEEASRAKSVFLANMSHEVRTPLNAIVGFAEILKDGMAGPVNSDQQVYLGDILESSRRLLGMITDILDLSQFEIGSRTIAEEKWDFALMFDDWLVPFRGQATKDDIALHSEIDSTVGAITSDPQLVLKVVKILLENAFKFTPRGGSVNISAAREKDKIWVTVCDTGIGMTESQLNWLFLPFQQGDSSTNKRYGGAGLGLVLCRRILEMLGGRIQVESEIGKGSRFTFFIPDMAGAGGDTVHPGQQEENGDDEKYPA